ncbi:MAG: hypothetical protein FWH29_06080 [Methanobrevibacter sp.]|nr:hypothetical protein [Methanobrevibacter sp.]
MEFKDYSFRDYLYKPIIIFSKSEIENFKKLNNKNQEENIFGKDTNFYEGGNSILAYGYNDHTAGTSFKALAICEYNEEDIKLFDLPDSFMMTYRKETFSNDSFIFPPDDLDTKPYSKMIEIANEGYYYGKDVEAIRNFEKIDKFRHDDYPDDIAVFLAKEKDKIESEDFFGKYDIEMIWVRTEKIKTDTIIQGTILNYPVNDFGINFENSIVDVHIGNEVCYIDTQVPLDIGNYFQLIYKQIENFKTEGNYEEVFYYYNELKNLGNLINDKNIFLDAVFNQSLLLLQSEQHDFALEILDEADLDDVNEDNFHLLSLKGQILIQKDESLEKALEIYEKVATHCKNPGKIVNFVDALTNQAIVYKKLGYFNETLDIYEKIEDIYRNNDIDDEMYLNTLRNKSIFLREFEKYSEAIETLKIMESIAKRVNSADFLNDSRFLLKDTFNLLKKDNVLGFFESSEKLYDKNNDIESHLRSDFKKIFVLFNKDDFGECLVANRKLIKSSKKQDNYLFLAYSLAFECFLLKYISPDVVYHSKKESYELSKKHELKEVLKFLDDIS